MWPYYSEDGEKVARAVYTIENPFHEAFQDLSEFSSEAQIADYVYDIEVRAKLGVSINQKPRYADRVRLIEPGNLVDPRSLKTNDRLINSRPPSAPPSAPQQQQRPTNPLRTLSRTPHEGLGKPHHRNETIPNRKPDPPSRIDLSKRPKLDMSISYSPLQNSHQSTKSSSGWNKTLNSAKPTAASNPIPSNPANYQPDYRSSVFKTPAQLPQQQASHNRFYNMSQSFPSNSNLVNIPTDSRPPSTPAAADLARRPQPPGPRLAFSFQPTQDIRIGANQSENFQVRTLNYNPNSTARPPPPQQQPIRNSACPLDPRMQNNYSRAQPTPPQVAANDPRMRANRTQENGGQQRANSLTQDRTRDANKREELQKRDEQLRRKEQELARREAEMEKNHDPRRAGSDPFAVDRSRTGNGDAKSCPSSGSFSSGLSMSAIKAIGTSNFEEDVKPKLGDYAAMTEILKRFKSPSPSKTPKPAEVSSRKDGSSLPNTFQSLLQNCVSKAREPTSNQAPSIAPFGKTARSPSGPSDESSKRIRWDHSYSKNDILSTDSNDSFLDSESTTSADMELDPFIESIASSRIDAEMGRDGTAMDVEANMRKIMGE